MATAAAGSRPPSAPAAITGTSSSSAGAALLRLSLNGSSTSVTTTTPSEPTASAAAATGWWTPSTWRSSSQLGLGHWPERRRRPAVARQAGTGTGTESTRTWARESSAAAMRSPGAVVQPPVPPAGELQPGHHHGDHCGRIVGHDRLDDGAATRSRGSGAGDIDRAERNGRAAQAHPPAGEVLEVLPRLDDVQRGQSVATEQPTGVDRSDRPEVDRSDQAPRPGGAPDGCDRNDDELVESSRWERMTRV